jgi:colanic acid/amylovoran biosynthesis glycosyltransferase
LKPGKLTVVHSISDWLPITETWLYNQVRFLPPSVTSHVVCESTQNLDQFPFDHVHCAQDGFPLGYWLDAGFRKFGFRRHLGFLSRQLRLTRADVMHTHFGNSGWQDLQAARRAGVRYVVTFYGLDVTYLPRKDPVWLDRYAELFEHVDRVLCEGPFMAQSVVELGCAPDKVQVHHLGVAVDSIPFRPRKWQGDEPLRVLMAASFKEKKGIPFGLEALGRIRVEVPLEITIIGDADNKPRSLKEKEVILSTLDRTGLTECTRLLGYQTHARMFDEAMGHHVFLSPSVTASDGDTEGGAPVSIIEMCASGMPVVSSRHCDIPGIVLDGQTGYLAEERDVDGLIDCFRRLIDTRAAWGDMLAASRAHIEKEFNAVIQGEWLAGIYRELFSTN